MAFRACLHVNTLYETQGGRQGFLSWPTEQIHLPTPTLSSDSKEDAPELLQEAEQSLIHYTKCNEMLKQLLQTSANILKKGVLCAYNALGKDSCQVSSWPFAASEFWLSPSKILHPQAVAPASPASPSIHPSCILRGLSGTCFQEGGADAAWRGQGGWEVQEGNTSDRVTCFGPHLCG